MAIQLKTTGFEAPKRAPAFRADPPPNTRPSAEADVVEKRFGPAPALPAPSTGGRRALSGVLSVRAEQEASVRAKRERQRGQLITAPSVQPVVPSGPAQGVQGMEVASAKKLQTSSSGAGLEVVVSVNDATVKQQFPKFDGLEQIEVWDSVSQQWHAAAYTGSTGSGPATQDTHTFRMGPTTQILLAQDIEIGVRVRMKVAEGEYATLELTDPSSRIKL